MQSASPTTFFQIASALIPALFFSGALRDVLAPKPEHSMPSELGGRVSLLGFVVPGGVLLAATAEVFAVAGALGADISEAGIYMVAATLVVGTFVLALQVALPWVITDRTAQRNRMRVANFGAVILILVCTALLHDSVKVAAHRLSTERVGQAVDRYARQLESRITSQQEHIRALLLGGKITRAEASRRLVANEDERLKVIDAESDVGNALDNLSRIGSGG
jgi:hypothetical protein